MTNGFKDSNNYGPVFSCGAASVSFSHKDGEPTHFDKFFKRVKSFFVGERPHNTAAGASDRSTATPYGVAS